MKIYNEIVIDMNPESSSYGETLHEDSYEYSGDMMLMDWTGTVYDYTDEDGNRWTARYNIGLHNRIKDIQIFKNGDLASSGTSMGGGSGDIYERADALTQVETYLDNVGATGRMPTQQYNQRFTYTDGEFDPTSAEFKEYVEETGGFDALDVAYGLEAGDVDEFYDAPLVAIEATYGPEGTLEQGRDLDLRDITETERSGVVQWGGIDPTTGEEVIGTEEMAQEEARRAGTTALDIDETIAEENLRIAGIKGEEGLRAATATQAIGAKTAGLQAGQSLTDIFAQTSAQQEKGGFGPGGATSAIGRRAQKGVMADYNLQQERLAEGMTQARSAFDISQDQAKSAFDISQKEIASGRLGVTSAYDIAGKTIESAQIGITTGRDIETERVTVEGDQAAIDYASKTADFWKTTMDKYYEDLEYIELHN